MKNRVKTYRAEFNGEPKMVTVPPRDAGYGISEGERVRNIYGETGTVFEITENTVWVFNDKNTSNAEPWHATKTFLMDGVCVATYIAEVE